MFKKLKFHKIGPHDQYGISIFNNKNLRKNLGITQAFWAQELQAFTWYKL